MYSGTEDICWVSLRVFLQLLLVIDMQFLWCQNDRDFAFSFRILSDQYDLESGKFSATFFYQVLSAYK